MANRQEDSPVDTDRVQDAVRLAAKRIEQIAKVPGGDPAKAISGAVLDLLASGEDPLEVGAVYETLLGTVASTGSATARKARGSYFTPRWLVELVLDLTLEPVIRELNERELLRLRVLDPACGSGIFLVCAAERIATQVTKLRGSTTPLALREALREVSAHCIHGIDRDGTAVAICRAAVGRAAKSDVSDHIIQADGLLDEAPSVDVVIGNPPFLNRLERATARDAKTAQRLRQRFGAAAKAYTDVSWLFLLRAVGLTRPGGRVGLVLPQSILGARDAAGVRAEVTAQAEMTDVWLADEHVFGASVHVCVPVFRKGSGSTSAVRRWFGTNRTPIEDSSNGASAGSWSHLAAVDVPTIAPSCRGTIGDIAEVTADFRDQYYGLVGHVVEDAGQDPARYAPLVTTGLIGVGRCDWGLVSCRFAGQRWKAPRVNLEAVDASLTSWVDARRRPKVLVATQTKVLEAAVDERGTWLPVTPLVTVIPGRPEDLWRLGAILCSPVLSILAVTISAGTGLSRGVIKLSATQVRSLPLPAGDCGRAGDLFRRAADAPEHSRQELLLQAASIVCEAYQLSRADADRAMSWWRGRMGPIAKRAQ